MLQALGSFSVQLSPDTPQSVIDAIGYYGHVVYVPGRYDVRQMGDALLKSARYSGIVRIIDTKNDQVSVAGVGMLAWLGDEDDKGHVFDPAVSFTDTPFATVINALLPPAVTGGSIYSVAGTYTGTHQYQSARTAIDYVCGVFDAAYRVNPDATLDAGPEANLFTTIPTAMVVRRGAGRDLNLRALLGNLDVQKDIADFTTEVILIGNGTGTTTTTATATIANNPYLDMYGNPIERTRIVTESSTDNTNADSRAQLALNRFSSDRKVIGLDTAEYDVEGSFKPGDYVYVYDVESGLYDLNHEVEFRGQTLHPTVIQVVGVSYPIEDGSTVAFRDGHGNWTDLTQYVVWEAGSSTVNVGSRPRTLTSSSLSDPAVGIALATAPDPTVTNATVPDRPSLNTPFSTSSYLDANGNVRAQIQVSWNEPLNTDGSVITDGAYYRIEYRVV